MMIYVWAGIALVALFLIWQIIRWWNLPATIEAREKAKAARAERWSNRPRIFGQKRAEIPVDPLPKPEEKPESIVEPSPVEKPKPRRPRKRLLKKDE